MLMKPLGSLRHQCLSGPGLSWSGHSHPPEVLESSDTQVGLLYITLYHCMVVV